MRHTRGALVTEVQTCALPICPVARQAHNLKVAGSNPAPATNRSDYIPRSRGTSQSSDWLFYCPRRAPCLGFAPPHARRAPMLTINGLTVRLGGRIGRAHV